MSQVSAQISKTEDEKIILLVKKGLFINKADLVRTAIRELLERFPSTQEASKRKSQFTHEERSS